MRARAFAVGVISVVSTLAMSSGVLSAPAGLDGAATAGQLATADRLHPPKPTAPARSAAQQVVDQLNIHRALHGLPAMHLDPLLSMAAQHHSEDQARMGRMSHVGSDRSTMAQRVNRTGFAWRALAENVAFGYPDANSVMIAWMDSPGHRRNNLSANTHVGAALALSATGTPYWTLVFGTPR